MEDVYAEGVCAEVVPRLCGGYAEVSVEGGMSVCPMLEDVWWLYQRMCGESIREFGGGCVESCRGCAEDVWRMSGQCCKSVGPDIYQQS